MKDEDINLNLHIIRKEEDDDEILYELHSNLKNHLESEFSVEEREGKKESGAKGLEVIVGLLTTLITSGTIKIFIGLLRDWIKRKNRDVELEKTVQSADGTIINKKIKITNSKMEEKDILKFLES
ncbi:MAG: hypothetical protein ACFFAS_20655 [Promethearchaeota archaeon]